MDDFDYLIPMDILETVYGAVTERLRQTVDGVTPVINTEKDVN